MDQRSTVGSIALDPSFRLKETFRIYYSNLER